MYNRNPKIAEAVGAITEELLSGSDLFTFSLNISVIASDLRINQGRTVVAALLNSQEVWKEKTKVSAPLHPVVSGIILSWWSCQSPGIILAARSAETCVNIGFLVGLCFSAIAANTSELSKISTGISSYLDSVNVKNRVELLEVLEQLYADHFKNDHTPGEVRKYYKSMVEYLRTLIRVNNGVSSEMVVVKSGSLPDSSILSKEIQAYLESRRETQPVEGRYYFVEHTDLENMMRDFINRYGFPNYPGVDPMDWPLPCDVRIGFITLRSGSKLRTLVRQCGSLHKLAMEQSKPNVPVKEWTREDFTASERASLTDVDDSRCRRDFESTYLNGSHGNATKIPSGDYVLPEVQQAWSVWQSCWTHLNP